MLSIGGFFLFKWTASDILAVLASGLEGECNLKKIFLTLRFPAVLPQGVFNTAQGEKT